MRGFAREATRGADAANERISQTSSGRDDREDRSGRRARARREVRDVSHAQLVSAVRFLRATSSRLKLASPDSCFRPRGRARHRRSILSGTLALIDGGVWIGFHRGISDRRPPTSLFPPESPTRRRRLATTTDAAREREHATASARRRPPLQSRLGVQAANPRTSVRRRARTGNEKRNKMLAIGGVVTMWPTAARSTRPRRAVRATAASAGAVPGGGSHMKRETKRGDCVVVRGKKEDAAKRAPWARSGARTTSWPRTTRAAGSAGSSATSSAAAAAGVGGATSSAAWVPPAPSSSSSSLGSSSSPSPPPS